MCYLMCRIIKKDKFRPGKGIFKLNNRFQKNPYIIGERPTLGL